eukprot:PhF_6_TR10170/c0_g1_i1/m.15783
MSIATHPSPPQPQGNHHAQSQTPKPLLGSLAPKKQPVPPMPQGYANHSNFVPALSPSVTSNGTNEAQTSSSENYPFNVSFEKYWTIRMVVVVVNIACRPVPSWQSRRPRKRTWLTYLQMLCCVPYMQNELLQCRKTWLWHDVW